MFVRFALHQNFYTIRPMFLLLELVGIGFGNYNALKKSKFSFGNPCIIDCLPVNICSPPKINSWCPRCNTSETTIHILRDCHWAKMVWCHSPSVLPQSFFHLPLQSWLYTNASMDTLILCHQLPWKIYFPILCWHLWWARNERIFNNQSCFQYQIIHKVVQCAT